MEIRSRVGHAVVQRQAPSGGTPSTTGTFGDTFEQMWTAFDDARSQGRNREALAMVASVPAGTFTAVTANDVGWCAIRTDAALACWGDPDDPTVSDAPAGTFRSLSGACAIRTSGELECFGATWWEDRRPPEGGSFKVVSASDWGDRGCALRTDGTLKCWGADGTDESDNDLPMRTPAGTFTAVSVGEYNACAIRADGRAVCWGEWDELLRPAPTMLFEAPEWVDRLTIPLRWSATPSFARITSYDIELVNDWDDHGYAIGGTPWLEATTDRSATFRGAAAGQSYCWRARARDADGIVST
jgi:hypothetical protein